MSCKILGFWVKKLDNPPFYEKEQHLSVIDTLFFALQRNLRNFAGMKRRVYVLLLLLAVMQTAVRGEVRDTLRADTSRWLRPSAYFAVRPDVWTGGADFFPVHEGLNAQISLSAMTGIGHHSPKGVGFGRDISLVYASPLGKQLTYTLGATTAGIQWGGCHYNQAGIGGTLNYEVNDRVSLSLAGYKDLVRPEGPLPYRYGVQRDYSVGASAFFKLLQNVFIQVSAGVSSWR